MSRLPKRKSVRLREYDYSRPGAYFVTICSQNRGDVFGIVSGIEIQRNRYGDIVADCIRLLPDRFTCVKVDAFVVMPNHIHCIIVMEDCVPSASDAVPPRESLGRIIAYLKHKSTKQINEIADTLGGRIWQRNYYEHVIRNEDELRKVRQYIENNPAKWAYDKYNPGRNRQS